MVTLSVAVYKHGKEESLCSGAVLLIQELLVADVVALIGSVYPHGAGRSQSQCAVILCLEESMEKLLNYLCSPVALKSSNDIDVKSCQHLAPDIQSLS